MSAAGTARYALLVARRDLEVEWAARDAAVTVLPLVAAVVVLAGLSFGPAPADLRGTAPGVLWLAVLLATVPLTRQVAAEERDDDAWDVLRALSPDTALFAGKTLAVWSALLLTWTGAAAVTSVLFDVRVPPAGALDAAFGSLALAALVVAFGVATARSDRRQGLLAVLVLPAGLPVLLAGTQSATPGAHALPWVALSAAFALTSLTAAWAVFPVLLED